MRVFFEKQQFHENLLLQKSGLFSLSLCIIWPKSGPFVLFPKILFASVIFYASSKDKF